MPGVRAVIGELLQQSKTISTRTVAERAGVSRQAAQKQLKAMVANGSLTVEGKARAAKYHVPKNPSRALWAKVDALAAALAGIDNPTPLTIHAQARMARAQRLDVASAGSLFRLSARLLLADVDCDWLTLDFTGVVDLGDEFVEEIVNWRATHPLTRVEIVNLAAALEARLPR